MRTENLGDTLRITDIPTLTSDTYKPFKEYAHGALLPTHKVVEVDLGSARSLDSDGIGALISVHKAICDRGGRVRLLFDPEIEYQIYRSVPHDLVYYCNRLKVPAGFIAGRHSDVVQQIGLSHTRRSFRVKRIEGGHLFPFERPQAAAEAVRQLAAELRGKRESA